LERTLVTIGAAGEGLAPRRHQRGDDQAGNTDEAQPGHHAAHLRGAGKGLGDAACCSCDADDGKGGGRRLVSGGAVRIAARGGIYDGALIGRASRRGNLSSNAARARARAKARTKNTHVTTTLRYTYQQQLPP
jgi:hypothetical protein